MKALRKYVDKIKPQFQKGGKLEKLHSTFDAFETFLTELGIECRSEGDEVSESVV